MAYLMKHPFMRHKRRFHQGWKHKKRSCPRSQFLETVTCPTFKSTQTHELSTHIPSFLDLPIESNKQNTTSSFLASHLLSNANFDVIGKIQNDNDDSNEVISRSEGLHNLHMNKIMHKKTCSFQIVHSYNFF
jgi:hypothetical protein